MEVEAHVDKMEKQKKQDSKKAKTENPRTVQKPRVRNGNGKKCLRKTRMKTRMSLQEGKEG